MKNRPKNRARNGFIRKTVSIPGELQNHIDLRMADPVFAQNFSQYVRSLIINDRAENETKAACSCR